MARYRFFALAPLVCFPLLSLQLALAQEGPAQGTPQFSSLSGDASTGIVQIGTLDVHFQIPVFQKPAGKLPFTSSLQYDNGPFTSWVQRRTGDTVFRLPVRQWSLLASLGGGVKYFQSRIICSNGSTALSYTNFYFVDSSDNAHLFPGSLDQCTGTPKTAAGSSADGWTFSLDITSGFVSTIKDPAGNVYSGDGTGPVVPCGPASAGCTNSTVSIRDSNGNRITVSNSYDTTSSTNTGTYTDATNKNPLTYSFQSSPTGASETYTYPNAAGGTETVTVDYSAFTLKTTFLCAGKDDINSTSRWLPTTISLPDGSSFLIVYESVDGTYPSTTVTGRLHSIKIPTGATITYTYSAGTNGIICSDGGPATLRKTITMPDGSSGGIWTYYRSYYSATKLWRTIVSDPAGNDTIYIFSSLVNDPLLGTTGDDGKFEVQRLIYQGGSHTYPETAGTLLQTILTCYNGNATNCGSVNTITTPITRRTVFLQIPNASGKQSKTDTFYSSGLVTQVLVYDFGNGAVGPFLRSTSTSYGSWNGTTCDVLGNNIRNQPCSIGVGDAGGSISLTYFGYDKNGVTALSGNSQHVAVSGSRGNLSNIDRFSGTGATNYIRHAFTYYDTGMVRIETDFNGAVTTYNYANATATCGNLFPTSVSLPLSFSRSMTWDCNGGVITSTTDENSKVTSYDYGADPLWRIMSVTDPLNNTTTNTYWDTGTVARSSVLAFDASQVHTGVGFDGLGREIVTNHRDGNGSYDTFPQNYDTNGRLNKIYFPCTSTTWTCSTPFTTTTYDALNRPLQITDGGLGTITYAYDKNAVTVTAGPAPAGENTKKKRLEYDALGRPTSACEISSAAGSGTCVQGTTGFLTTYTYDSTLVGTTRYTRMTVKQNAQSTTFQTRTYLYDQMGRLGSETNPESGTTTYHYDTWSGCSQSSNGDLVHKVDAAGNNTCFAYDAYHRVTSTTFPSGPNSVNTPSRTFIYDSTTFTCPNGANVKSRLAEAYTGTSTSKITDIAYCYSARGEVTDLYESTPHSGGYYHTTASYWANGVLNTLGGVPGHGTWTFGVDGEGRLATASAGTTDLVTGTTYNAGSQATNVVLGLGDTDAYQYDPNTGRMTQYKFTVGATPVSLTGNLTWNPNGTLKQQAITDGFNSANNQTCTYTYDDFARLSTANCGALWSQTFGFDPFGNIGKSGSSSFQATYSSSSNRIQSLPGCVPTYDANGNLTYDCVHNYTWNSDGRPVTIDTTAVTYDAFGHMVEKNVSGTFTEYLYSPGGKLGTMNGQTTQVVTIPLPGGASVIHNDTISTIRFRHADWLGSIRATSTLWNRTLVGETAWAPYGESYRASSNPPTSFTGLRPDTAPDLQDALYRSYSPVQGRWLSPDPAGLGAADLANPQSWNRYAYVNNNPLSLVDPSGLECLQTKGDACDPFGPGFSDFGFDLFGGFGRLCWRDNFFGGDRCLGDNPFTGEGLRDRILPGDNELNFPVPPLAQTIWADVLGLPTGLNCPQIAGTIAELLCGGVSPISDLDPNNGQPQLMQNQHPTFLNPSPAQCAQIRADTSKWISATISLWTFAKLNASAPWTVWGLPLSGIFGAGAIAAGTGSIPGNLYLLGPCNGK